MKKWRYTKLSNVTALDYDKLVTGNKIMIENLKRSKKMLQLLIECKGKKMQVLHDATSDVVSV